MTVRLKSNHSYLLCFETWMKIPSWKGWRVNSTWFQKSLRSRSEVEKTLWARAGLEEIDDCMTVATIDAKTLRHVLNESLRLCGDAVASERIGRTP